MVAFTTERGITQIKLDFNLIHIYKCKIYMCRSVRCSRLEKTFVIVKICMYIQKHNRTNSIGAQAGLKGT